MLDDGYQGGLDEFLHQAVRGVVAACGLARRSALPLLTGLPAQFWVAQKTEAPGRGIHMDDGLEFQQAFIDAAELLGIHVTVVDAHKAAVAFQPAQVEQGLVEAVIGQSGLFQVRALVRIEKTAQCRLGEQWLATAESLESDKQLRPGIVMAVLVAAQAAAGPGCSPSGRARGPGDPHPAAAPDHGPRR